MTATLGVLRAVFVRDMQAALSYRVGFLLTLAGSAMNAVGLFFLGRTFGGAAAPLLDAYGGSYFGFAVIGVALTTFMSLGIGGIAQRVREGQLMGTLELMLVSPNRLPTVLLGSTLWSHAVAGLSLAVYAVAAITLGADFAGGNLVAAAVAFALAVVSFNAIGLLAASVVILVKQGDPVTWLVSSASILLAGVFYPTAVLPDTLRALGQLLPLTHALEIVRLTLLTNAGIEAIWPSFAALALLTAAFVVVGVVASNVAVGIARRDGNLSQY